MGERRSDSGENETGLTSSDFGAADQNGCLLSDGIHVRSIERL